MFFELLLSIAVLVMGQTTATTKSPITTKPPKLVSKDKYEETLKHYISWEKNLSSPDFYKRFVWKGRRFNKKFPELAEFEKNQIYIIHGLKLEQELYRLKLAWDNEIWWLKNERVEIPENAATIKEIEEFQKQLLKLRKKTAVAFEKLIDVIFKKYKAKIPKKERDFIKAQIIKFHDKFGLIERKDES